MKTPFGHRPSSFAGRSRKGVGRHQFRSGGGTVTFKQILVPVNFTAGSERALRHAAKLAAANHAKVLPLHVTSPICFTTDCGYGPVNQELPDEALMRRCRAKLRRMAQRVFPAPLAGDIIVRSGQTIEQIVLAAKEWKIDLIIMVARDGTLGDPQAQHTVDAVMRQVRCPVLVLHRPPDRKKILFRKRNEHLPTPRDDLDRRNRRAKVDAYFLT